MTPKRSEVIMFDLFAGIGSFISGIADAGVDIYNSIMGQQNAQENFELQKQKFEYDKDLTLKNWARDDNAVQRRVADLKAAGLSPVLAAGSAATTSSPVSVTAPQKQFVPFKAGDMQQKAALAMSMMRQAVDYSMSQEQLKLIRLQQEGQANANLKTVVEAEKAVAERDNTILNTHVTRYNYDYYHDMRLPTNPTEDSKSAAEMINQLAPALPTQVKGAAGKVVKKLGDIINVVLPAVLRRKVISKIK